MRTQHRLPLAFVTRSLVAIWLFLGCVAFTDQLQLTQETGTQDEQALLQLASSLKPDLPHLDALSDSVIITVSGSLSTGSPEGSPNQATHRVFQAIPILRLHQLVSVYRI